MRQAAPRDIPPPASPPPLLVADWALPPYRYVPGLHPHPFRHPGGHLYTDGNAPVEAPWSADLPWEQDRRWRRGLDLFNHRYLWEAHEAWEALWHFAENPSAERELLQALIQLSAGLLKRHQGEVGAASRLLERARTRLARAEALGGARVRGLWLPTLRAKLEALGEVGEGWVVIVPG